MVDGANRQLKGDVDKNITIEYGNAYLVCLFVCLLKHVSYLAVHPPPPPPPPPHPHPPPTNTNTHTPSGECRVLILVRVFVFLLFGLLPILWENAWADFHENFQNSSGTEWGTFWNIFGMFNLTIGKHDLSIDFGGRSGSVNNIATKRMNG